MMKNFICEEINHSPLDNLPCLQIYREIEYFILRIPFRPGIFPSLAWWWRRGGFVSGIGIKAVKSRKARTRKKGIAGFCEAEKRTAAPRRTAEDAEMAQCPTGYVGRLFWLCSHFSGFMGNGQNLWHPVHRQRAALLPRRPRPFRH